MNRPAQFRLRSLFIATGIVALLLGLWRLTGSRFGLALVLGIELVLPFVWRRRWLYSWFLPLLWTTVACNSYYHPGDEYGSFIGGSLAGVWIVVFVGGAGSFQRAALLVVPAGAATVAVAGWLLDKLRSPLLPWSALFLLTAASLFAWSIGSYPSVERALAKNGSYEAYILPSINLGLTFATAVMLLGVSVYRGCKLMHKSNARHL